MDTVYKSQTQFLDDPFYGRGCQSEEGALQSDVFPLRNVIIQQCRPPHGLEVTPKRGLCGMTSSLRGVMHEDLKQKAELTLKGVVGIIIKKYFPHLAQSQRVLFEDSPCGIFLGMHIPHGDPLLVNTMMLHEIFEMGNFPFDIEGIQLDFGETEYILICGLKVGPYVDLLHEEQGQSNSKLRARLFPYISDARLRLKDLEELIMSPNYLALQDEDVVMLIQLVFMFKGLHGWDIKIGISVALYKLADNIDDLNRFAWGTYFWNYTSRMMRGIEFKQANPESKKGHKYTVPGFMLPFKIWILETFPEETKFYLCTPTEFPRMKAWRSRTPLNCDQCC
uniref:DUF1985 domain-containing protein n=1 Tax=Lactuca sativa TaxID=4236 RepID=A0A9R1W9K9_LACSA|nr:hypothetical protein LSAT_V11C200070430 [Lactuca sativa]